MVESSTRTCSIEGCGRPSCTKGLCSRHYNRLWRGVPLTVAKEPAGRGEAAKFYRDVVVPYDGEDCLLWPYNRGSGYALMFVDGKNVVVSRHLCEETHGPPPTVSHQAAHSCGKGHLGCVAKAHLSWKTPSENQADRIEHGTITRGEKNPLAKLTEEQVREIRSLKGRESQTVTAKRFGVVPSQISHIQTGKVWSWLSQS